MSTEPIRYTIKHLGINAATPEEAEAAAKLFCGLFGLTYAPGKSSDYAGDLVEVKKGGGRGRNGHLGIAVPDVPAAMADMEGRGVAFDAASARYTPEGKLYFIYLAGEYAGFAIHLVQE